MPTRKVFLDANVIIEAFRIGVWAELSQGHWLETVQKCEQEALTGENSRAGRVSVDPKQLRAGLKASHLVGRPERNQLVKNHRDCLSMDDGEKDLFAHLFVHASPLPPIIVMSTADKGAIVRAKDLGWLDNLISLEELLGSCGTSRSKMATLAEAYTAHFSDRGRLFQADRGRRFSVIMDDQGARE